MTTTTQWLAACLLCTGSAAALAQHTGKAGHNPHAGHGASTAAAAPTPPPYAGQQSRAIKALSAQEAQDLIEGKGMGLAKAAELNSYPGPMHVLEHAQALRLSETQQADSTALLAAHKHEVRALGQQLVEAERELDQAFATRQIDSASLSRRMQRIGLLQATIRDAHLQTHLKQTALLTPAQVAQYNQLRGYSDGTGATHKH